MKKIFAKELAALAVLALAFTGCNTAFDGTNANFAEKEAEYTDYSGATYAISDAAADANVRGNAVASGNIYKNNKKNEIVVTITSFSKINIGSADDAIHFQLLSNNTANAAYYPNRGADLPKTRIKVEESYNSSTKTETTVITYEVDGTGVTTKLVAFFVDATKLKTKGGSAVLALDRNPKRGEVSDSVIQYLTADGTTAITYTYAENFRPTYAPTGDFGNPVALRNTAGDFTGVYRISVDANNKSKPGDAAAYDDLSSKFAAVLQVREPTSRNFSPKDVKFTYHESAQTTVGDAWNAHTYTADIGPFAIGSELRLVITNPDGLTAPAWYSEVYGHPGIVYGYGNGVGAKRTYSYGAYAFQKDVPSYITVSASDAINGPAATFTPTLSLTDGVVESAQASYFTVSKTDNWFDVRTVTGIELDPAAAKDFIVVDNNNKKIDADVEVILYSYNDSTALSGKVRLVKITVKDARYRNGLPTTASGSSRAAGDLSVCVGSNTKIKENKKYTSQLSFGMWKDVAKDDASGYVRIN